MKRKLFILAGARLLCLACTAMAQSLPPKTPDKSSPWPAWPEASLDPKEPPVHQPPPKTPRPTETTTARAEHASPDYERSLAEARRLREEWRRLHARLPAVVPAGKTLNYYNDLLADIKRAREAKTTELNAWAAYYQSLDAWWTGIRSGANASEGEVQKRLTSARQMLETEKAELTDIESRIGATTAQQSGEPGKLQEIRDTKADNVKDLERTVNETEAAQDKAAALRQSAQNQIDFAARQQHVNVIERILFDAIYQSLELPAKAFAAEQSPKPVPQPRGLN